MKRTYTLCEGLKCPIKDKCARHQEDLDRKMTDYFEPIPYQHNRYKPYPNGTNCFYFDADKSEDIIHLLGYGELK